VGLGVFLCFLAMESIIFSLLIYIVGVIFQVGFNCKYGEHINTCEISFLVCEPTIKLLLSFQFVANNGLVFLSLTQVWVFFSSSFCVVSLPSQLKLSSRCVIIPKICVSY
jgi:hypothetical protein